MSRGADAPDFQWCRHYVDLLAREVFQKPVPVDECDSVAGVKKSHGVGVRDLWQAFRGKHNGCSGIDLAPEPKARPQKYMHGSRNDD